MTNNLKLLKNLWISHQGRDSQRLWSVGCCNLLSIRWRLYCFLPGDPRRKMRKRSVLRKIWTQFVKSFCQNFLIALFKFKIQALVRLRRVFKLSLTKISFLAENRQIANCPCSIILFTHLSWNGKLYTNDWWWRSEEDFVTKEMKFYGNFLIKLDIKSRDTIAIIRTHMNMDY